MSRAFIMMVVTATMTLTWLLLLLLSPLIAQEAQTSETAPFPLAEAIKRARAVAPQRQAAQDRIQAAEGSVRQAQRPPNPSLDVRQENLGAGSPVDQILDVFATVSQTVEIGGKRAARTAVAAADVKIAQAIALQAERNLTLETVRLYLAALQAHSFLEFLSKNREELQLLIAAQTRRQEEGYAAEADLMKFHTEASRLDTRLLRIQLTYNRSLTSLSMLLDLSPPLTGARLVMPSNLAPPRGDPAELAQRVVERQPEIIVAQAQLDRARQAVALEKAKRLPDPALTVGYKRTGGADTLVTGVTMPLPIFDSNDGNIERAIAEEHAAAMDLAALRKQQLLAIEALIRSAQELTEREQQIERQMLQPAEVVRNAAHSSFHEGAANILQLVDAERVYTETRQEALELKLEAYVKAFEAQLLLSEEEQP